ncbi:unnamed protein product [Dicrocoelium dendriticum]|nr:unnamed protein product [Dicrocoelium dendriticum]
MFDFGPAPNELTQNSLLRCPTNVSIANPFRAQNHGLLDSSQRMEQSSSGDCFIACPELFMSMEPWRQYSLLTLPRGRNSVALSVGQSFLPITTTTVSPALHHKSSVLWTRSNPPVEFRGSHHDVVCEGSNRPQPHSAFLNSHPLVVSQSNYPTGDSLSPSSLDNSSQGTSQDLDEFRADLNSTDPLMTDVVGDPGKSNRFSLFSIS